MKRSPVILTYKYRLKDSSARKALQRHAFSVNQVWNFCVETQRKTERLWKYGAANVPWLSHYDLIKLTKGSSRDLGIHAQTIQVVCHRFTLARTMKRRSPVFRASGGTRRAFGWVPFQMQSRQIDGNSVTYYGKRYRFFGQKRRPLPATVKGGWFVEDARGRWYVCFQVEVQANRPTGVGEIGIDLGLKTLATISDGEKIVNFQHFRRYQVALATASRAGNKKRVQALHAKIANARKDQHHKATTKIARENRLIIVGDVSASKLKKTRMAKSVSDAGWSHFRTMLAYKAILHRAEFKIADERWTSQVCSRCGVISDSSPKGRSALGIREWECSGCGAVHDRDVNAAINILAVGRSAPPHADESRRAA